MKKVVFLVALLLALGAPAQATPITYTATLLGSAEVPPNPSTAFGTATVVIDTGRLELTVAFSGLVGGPALAAHLHCCAPPGVAAAVAVGAPGFPAATAGAYFRLFDLTLTGTYSGGFLAGPGGGTAAGAEAALASSLAAGLVYFNIHDSVFPGGEIRGQLTPIPEPATLTLVGLGLGAVALRRRRGLKG